MSLIRGVRSPETRASVPAYHYLCEFAQILAFRFWNATEIRDFSHSPILPSDHARVCFARLELYDRLYKNHLITFCGIFIRKFHMNFDNFEVII